MTSFVDNSVQAQFASLNKERDALRNAAAAADRDRRREEEMLQNLRSSQVQFEESLRVAHAELGAETRKKKILDDEKKRLKGIFDSDRQTIVKVTSELKGIAADEKKQKMEFVKEMENLNNELDFLLNQCENRKTLGLLDSETMTWLLDEKLNQKLISLQSNANSVCIDGSDGVDFANSTEIEKWNDFATKIRVELQHFLEAQEKHAAEVAEKKELEELVQGLRSKFMAENPGIGEMEIDDLEAKWEQQWDYDDGANNGNSMGDELGEDARGNQPNGPGEKLPPVHMELFYDANDYADPLNEINASSDVPQYGP